jgi:DNA-directed RNA polymerase specialized sigma24 family protein
VRRFILDRFDQLRRRGQRTELDSEAIALPDDADLAEMVELAQLRKWIFERVADLEANKVDPRVRIPVVRAPEVGAILRLHLAGKTQREIAAALVMSVGAVNKRLAEGTSYLVLLQSIELGLGDTP